ncbi:NAD(P)H-dependent oxidoreductase subunit E [bacterium]|nr:NAD(P)H-dependent oxidoreductase subunit E [bacterium]
MKTEEVANLTERHLKAGDGLISILEDIQGKHGYLPEEALREVAEQTGRSLVDIYGVATFYRAFSLTPRGRHLIAVCSGTACHVRGGPRVIKEIEQQLGISAGETTPDREFTLETVACLGACALGPVVVIDGHYLTKVETTKVKGIIEQARKGLDKVEVKGDERVFPIEVSCPRCNHSLIRSDVLLDGIPAIRVTVAFDHKHGWLSISSLYGSYTVSSKHHIPEDTIVDFFCPHCHAELLGGTMCPECGAPMVPMIVRGGGIVQICSRRGCKGHMLDISGTNL